jgi:hypothetical protein
LRGALVDAGDGVEEVDLSRERGEALLDLSREPLDSVLEILDVREQFAHDERVVRLICAGCSEEQSRMTPFVGSCLRLRARVVPIARPGVA